MITTVIFLTWYSLRSVQSLYWKLSLLSEAELISYLYFNLLQYCHGHLSFDHRHLLMILKRSERIYIGQNWTIAAVKHPILILNFQYWSDNIQHLIFNIQHSILTFNIRFFFNIQRWISTIIFSTFDDYLSNRMLNVLKWMLSYINGMSESWSCF